MIKSLDKGRNITGYQPEKGEFDTENPPQEGSGVPLHLAERIDALTAENDELNKESEMLAESLARLSEGEDCIIANLERENAELKKAILERWYYNAPHSTMPRCFFCGAMIDEQTQSCNHTPDCIVLRCQPKEGETK